MEGFGWRQIIILVLSVAFLILVYKIVMGIIG